MIVLDAWAFAEHALKWPKAALVEAAMFAPGETLHAPHLLDVSTDDATYVALTDFLGAKFLTLNARLANAVRAHTNVELV